MIPMYNIGKSFSLDTILCKQTFLTLTNFSESPRHLLTMLDADILKNVVLHSVATAFANNVLPVPVKK